MKTQLLKSKYLAASLAMLGAQLVSAPVSSAANLFPVTVNAVSVSTNQNGNLAYHSFNNWTIIHATAAEQGLTNLTGLAVVYNLDADNLQVVSGTNKTVLDTPLTFGGGVSLNNTNTTKVQRLTNVYWQTNQTSVGTMVAGESIHYGTNNLITSFSLAGQLQFALPGSGTNSPTIYYGFIRSSRYGTCASDGERHGGAGEGEQD